jgi:hypothetical protein
VEEYYLAMYIAWVGVACYFRLAMITYFLLTFVYTDGKSEKRLSYEVTFGWFSMSEEQLAESLDIAFL